MGNGGMGEVYRRHDDRLRRDVAMRVSMVRFSERLEREARVIASLPPNTCPCRLFFRPGVSLMDDNAVSRALAQILPQSSRWRGTMAQALGASLVGQTISYYRITEKSGEGAWPSRQERYAG